MRCSGHVTYNVTLTEKTSRRKRDLLSSAVTMTTTNTFVDVFLQYGNTYEVCVTAVNTGGLSSNSSQSLFEIHPRTLIVGLEAGLGVGVPLLVVIIVLVVMLAKAR